MGKLQNAFVLFWIGLFFSSGICGRRGPYYPDWTSKGRRNQGGAQDPETVDDDFGWSWGITSGGHSQKHNQNSGRQIHSGGDFAFDYGDFYGTGDGDSDGGWDWGDQPQGQSGVPTGGFKGREVNDAGQVSSQQQQQQFLKAQERQRTIPTVSTSTPRPISMTSTTRRVPTTPSMPSTGTQRPTAGQQGSPLSATSIVYSDEFYMCLNQCQATNEWNPVCGTDQNDYNNIERLNCANRCGANVQQHKSGPCRPFGK